MSFIRLDADPFHSSYSSMLFGPLTFLVALVSLLTTAEAQSPLSFADHKLSNMLPVVSHRLLHLPKFSSTEII